MWAIVILIPMMFRFVMVLDMVYPIPLFVWITLLLHAKKKSVKILLLKLLQQ